MKSKVISILLGVGVFSSGIMMGDNTPVRVVNKTDFTMSVSWEYAGDYFRRAMGPGGSTFVADWRLFKGFAGVHTVGVKVGDVWGKDPETGKPLVFTEKMLSSKGAKTLKLGECFGYKNDIEYYNIGKSLYGFEWRYLLTMSPKRNDKDNNNWWPSFTLREGGW